MRAAARRLIRAVAILARDGRTLRPLRGPAAFGVMTIPGQFDEVVLLVVGLVLWAFSRDRLRLRDGWSQAATPVAQPS